MILKTAKQSVKTGLCLGCGLCQVLDKNCQMHEYKGRFKPNKKPSNGLIDKVCPAIGYNLKLEAQDIFGEECISSYELGSYKQIFLARSTDEEVTEGASSGGIITQLAYYLLSSGEADGIICTKYICHEGKSRPLTFIARTKEDLLTAQGSKYCPTSTLQIISEVKSHSNEKFVLIGTPCQIAGFRLIAKHDALLDKQIILTVSNFCGGYRGFEEMDFFVKKLAGFKDVVFFRHRGGGQPGGMLIKDSQGREFSYPYPSYAKLSPFVKNERCTLCMDATGELADVSCGDAWIDRIKATSIPTSIAIARSDRGLKAILLAAKSNQIVLDSQVSADEVVTSQKLNLTSKKYRQFKRICVRKALLLPYPNWYNYFEVKEGSYIKEFKTILSKTKDKWITLRGIKG